MRAYDSRSCGGFSELARIRVCAIDLALSDPSSTSETSLEIATTSDHTGCDSIPGSVLRTLQSDCCSHDQTSICKAKRPVLWFGILLLSIHRIDKNGTKGSIARTSRSRVGSLQCLEYAGGPLATVDLDH